MKAIVRNFIRRRYWLGWWWASFCSLHFEYNDDCYICQAGDWTRKNHQRLFGKHIANTKDEVSE